MDLRLDVAFYNEEEKELLKKNYPSEFEKINKVVKTGYIQVPFADFKTYSQMQHRNTELEKLNSFNAIQQNIGDLYGNVNFYTHFDCETGRFYSSIPHNNEQSHVSESIGCGGLLSVVGAIYGLTQADWQRIDIQGHKDFDFDSAVIDGFTKMVVVEAKGSIVEDNTLKANLSNHKRKIKEKKEDEDFKNKYSKGADLLIGGITAIDDVNHAKVYLIDPPMKSDMSMEFKFKIKILKRLTYYLDWLSIISSRAYLTIALKNRVKAIEKLDNIDSLNSLMLVNAKDEVLKIRETFYESKSHIDEQIMGKLYVLNSKKAVFIGLSADLCDLIAIQDFNAISKYKTDSYIEKKQINLKISNRDAESLYFIKNIDINYKKTRSDSFNFIVDDAIVFQNSAGVNYSILTSKNKYFIPYE
ncbi:hypothetical protein [Flavobacterium sp. 25HG05S-40]|uniref:hypothetical protein n=1 Tax=Flavobacterium sp. 25HG05S-40 TaxID=3458682 RepID=UPI0040440FE6